MSPHPWNKGPNNEHPLSNSWTWRGGSGVRKRYEMPCVLDVTWLQCKVWLKPWSVREVTIKFDTYSRSSRKRCFFFHNCDVEILANFSTVIGKWVQITLEKTHISKISQIFLV
jgi:hypothetical protein